MTTQTNDFRDPVTGMMLQEFAAAMAMDAFRLAMGFPLRNFTRSEVLRWLELAP